MSVEMECNTRFGLALRLRTGVTIRGRSATVEVAGVASPCCCPGGFANANIGFIYLQNASVHGTVYHLFLDFEVPKPGVGPS